MKFSARIAGALREAYTPSGLARIALGPPPASRVIPQAELGLIFEVKDWEKETISRIGKDFWEINADGRSKQVRSPLEQVRNYYWELAKLFQTKNVLLREDGPYKGGFKLPITYAAAFTRMRRKELPPEAERQLDPHKFLFRDDLKPLGGTVTGPRRIA